jgi:hypothetical protein
VVAPATHETTRVPSRRAGRIPGASFGLLILLIIQYLLGIGYNLYGTAPTASKKIDAFSSPLLALHAILGTVLILAAIYLVVGAVRARIQLAVFTSLIGLLSLIAAWVSGSVFAQKGASGYSMAMGVMTAVALLCYAVKVRVFSGRGSE